MKKVLVFAMTLFSLFLFNSAVAQEDTEEEAMMDEEGMMAPPSAGGRTIRVSNEGAFAVREFVLTYDTGKKTEVCISRPADCDRNSSSYRPDETIKSAGPANWNIPANATNVRIVANVVMGKDRKKWLDSPSDFNACYVTTGTTLSSDTFVRKNKGTPGCP